MGKIKLPIVTFFSVLLAFMAFNISTVAAPLASDQAFNLHVKRVNNTTINANWKIAKNFYLYKGKISISLAKDNGTVLGKINYPKGILKENQVLGKHQVYADSLSINIPVKKWGKGDTDLLVKYQGCEGDAMCYPPVSKVIAVSPPKNAPSFEAPATDSNSLAAPLTSDQAFNLHVKRINNNTINANWKIAKTFHLYKDKVSISLANENGTVLGKIDYPKGIQKENQLLGKYQVYEGNLNIKIPVKTWGKGDTDLLFKYQGCKGEAMCYPPVSKVIAISPPANASLIAAAPSQADSSSFSTPSLSSTQSLLKGGNMFLILGSFFVFGLFLSLTPCVLPMIPILVGLVLGHKDIKTYKAFLLSLSYVLGMAITYAVAGIITALLGNSVQAILQNVYVITACSIIFVLLALSLFGLYELQLPSFLTNKLNSAANKTKSGSYLGVFIMGVISSLIVSPCVSAPLTGTLIYIATTGNMLLGGSALFVLALGMGVLLLIAGTSGGKFLVKAGGWMQVVRYFLGVVMIVFAIWMLGRIIPTVWTDLLYGLLLVGTALYMGAIEPVGESRWKRFVKMIAFFILIWGVALSLQFFLPGMTSSNVMSRQGNVSQVGTSQKVTKAKTNHEPGFTKITTVQELDKLIAKAKKENKPVIIDYYADWCTDCKEMEVTTFKDLNVQQALKSFVAVQADITKNNAVSKALKKKYKVFGPPYFVFLTPQGKQIQQMSIAGMINAKDLIQHLNIVTTVYGSQK